VAVVGGGIGGLTAAVALLRAGLDVRVYEPARLVWMDALEGLPVTTLDLGPAFRQRFRQPYIVMHRGDLLSVLLQAYDESDGTAGRIRISVPKLDMGEAAATTLALVVHELATNSLKYGALSVETGTLDLACPTLTEAEVVLVWTERGGPPVEQPSAPAGFGSDLIRRSMAHQFGGGIVVDWSPEGVIVTLRMQRDRLAA